MKKRGCMIADTKLHVTIICRYKHKKVHCIKLNSNYISLEQQINKVKMSYHVITTCSTRSLECSPTVMHYSIETRKSQSQQNLRNTFSPLKPKECFNTPMVCTLQFMMDANTVRVPQCITI